MWPATFFDRFGIADSILFNRGRDSPQSLFEHEVHDPFGPDDFPSGQGEPDLAMATIFPTLT
jgi:hypothetical protein